MAPFPQQGSLPNLWIWSLQVLPPLCWAFQLISSLLGPGSLLLSWHLGLSSGSALSPSPTATYFYSFSWLPELLSCLPLYLLPFLSSFPLLPRSLLLSVSPFLFLSVMLKEYAFLWDQQALCVGHCHCFGRSFHQPFSLSIWILDLVPYPFSRIPFLFGSLNTLLLKCGIVEVLPHSIISCLSVFFSKLPLT